MGHSLRRAVQRAKSQEQASLDEAHLIRARADHLVGHTVYNIFYGSVSTTALRGAHCGVGVRWAAMLRRRWRAAEAAEAVSQVSVGLGDGPVGAGHLEDDGGDAGALGGGGR